MARIPTYKALLKFFNERSADVKIHFAHLPKLINEKLPYEIAIAYVFLKIEQAQNRALYGGVVKIHRGNADFTKRIMNFQHLTRDGFKAIYKNVFGHAISEATSDKLKEAEKSRDKVIHGKSVTDNDLREAIADVLEYAELFNSEVNSVAGFKPFADMRGFKGKADSLDIRTTKWLMRGLGFGIKA
ncbi:hypothetical protein [Chromobacterium rhizoryzae]|uniref:RiboL-PSP-HEPN domain-containing protein n=1 Tax=Chromobacterium rhizoryzae TaxID=1778675 RepID=A0AAD0W9Q2_9NEIS|nr:hypothetical protein [Chromobacterium rhizoryzae]AXT47696.1 hypothetical protein D1345_16580 [Chromobacterium rhizoryzae]